MNRPRCGTVRCALFVVALAWLAPVPCGAADNQDQPASTKDLREQTLPLRTALHHDPTLDAPLEALVKLYRKHNRVDKLIGLYDQHLQRWPQDTSARIVWLRLLLATSDPAARSAARAAAQAHPNNPHMHYLRYRAMNAAGRDGTLDHLDRAIELQNDPRRKRRWIDQFLPPAEAAGRDKQITGHLRTLAELSADSPEQQVDAAKKMIAFNRHKMALQTLGEASKQSMPAELSVDLELTAARAEQKLGRRDAAAARLDALLDRLAADYWRRPQIMRQRLALAESDDERQAMIDAARKRMRNAGRNPAAALDLADLLIGFDRHRTALDVLLDAGRRMPESPTIESATLKLFDRLRDETGRAKYLRRRLERHAERRDLRIALARTQYLLGRNNKAHEQLEQAIESLGAEERFDHLLETARFCRRSSLMEAAAALFERTIDLRPARLGVWRELAEVYLTLDQRGEVQAMFDEPVPGEAPIEDVLDLADFLVDKDFLAAARKTLEPRIEARPTHLELRLLLLRVHGKLAATSKGGELAARARRLTDTPARYRRWLQAAADFHANFDTLKSFLDGERARLAGPPKQWDELAVERRLIFADVAARYRLHELARAAITTALEHQPPKSAALQFRRRRITLLRGTEDVATLEKALEELAKHDAEARHEMRARLARLHAQHQRFDKVESLLDAIDPRQINEVKLLGDLRRLYEQTGRQDRIPVLLERQVQINPTGRDHWQQWLAALAAYGDEQRFRGAVRKLLAGIDKMKLDAASHRRLHAHLLSSYWRSVSRRMEDDDPARLHAALGQLDAAQRIINEDRQLMWVMWMRAAILNRLNRTEARDEAIGELNRLAAHDGNDNSPAEIAFPDGLRVALDEAVAVLTRDRTDAHTRPSDPAGPMPAGGALARRWTFRTDGAGVTAIVDGPNDAVIVCDDGGGVWAVGRRSGKLMWHEPDALAPTSNRMRAMTIQRGSPSMTHIAGRPPTPIAGPGHHLIISDGREVLCYALAERRLAWRSPLWVGDRGLSFTPHVDVALVDDAVLAHDPVDNRLLWLDLATGKLLDELAMGDGNNRPQHPGLEASWLSAGMHRRGDRAIVFGRTTAIVDLERRSIAWRFDSEADASFPIRLRSPDDVNTSSSGMRMGMAMHSSRAMPAGYSSYSSWLSNAPPHLRAQAAARIHQYRQMVAAGHLSYHQAQSLLMHAGSGASSRINLTSPAVAWSEHMSSTGRLARLGPGRALLMADRGLMVWRLDNPLGAATITANGMLLGTYGRITCLVGPQSLMLIDTDNAESRAINIGLIGRVTDGLVDGPVVYVVGTTGAVAVNVTTGHRMWHHRWSAGDDAPSSAQNAQAHHVFQQYFFRGIGWTDNVHGGARRCRPVVAHTSGGVLYATRGSDEVIALGEATDP